MKALHEKNGFEFSRYLAIDIGLLLLGYVAAFFLLNREWYILAWIVSVFLGGRWHGLGVLVHECAHLAAFKNKKLNILFGEIFAPFVLIDFKRYQTSHFRHHSQLNRADDPDNQKYMYYLKKFNLNNKFNLILFIVFYPFVYFLFSPKTEFRKEFKAQKSNRKIWNVAYPVALQIAIFFALSRFENMIYFHLVTGYMSLVIKNVREIFEHHLVLNVESRSYFNTDFFLRNTIYVHNIGFHELHHKYPGIPFYRLQDAERLVSTQSREDISNTFDLVSILSRNKFKP